VNETICLGVGATPEAVADPHQLTQLILAALADLEKAALPKKAVTRKSKTRKAAAGKASSAKVTTRRKAPAKVAARTRPKTPKR